jgi:hypothetical protein
MELNNPLLHALLVACDDSRRYPDRVPRRHILMA